MMDYDTDRLVTWVEPDHYLSRNAARLHALELLAPLVECKLQPYLEPFPPHVVSRVIRQRLRQGISESSTPSSDKDKNHCRILRDYCENSVECPIPAAIYTKYPEHQLTAYKKLAHAMSYAVDEILSVFGKSDATGAIRESVAPAVLLTLLQHEDVIYTLSPTFRVAEAAMASLIAILEPGNSAVH